MKSSGISPICAVELDWQHIDGMDIPISQQFGDVYFSKANGLLETRHVFLKGNDLALRFAALQGQQTFVIGEIGFGTGLNFLATWQLWQQVRPNAGNLHYISVEKYPLTRADLARALAPWHELQPLAKVLLQHYPPLIAGCHRIVLHTAHLTLDLWFGDAAECLAQMTAPHGVDAWYLDGFAPKCNPELWQQTIFDLIIALSREGTTFASFSVAGVVKRALKEHGITVTRPSGFGHKREMLKAYWQQSDAICPVDDRPNIATIKVIGAGIAGLMVAYAAARRGIAVTLCDAAPLSGASGNPLALINPKLCAIEQAPQHLMTCSWQFALDFYRQFDGVRVLHIQQIPHSDKEKIDLYRLVADYPPDLVNVLVDDNGQSILNIASIAVEPYKLAAHILAHPLITPIAEHVTHLPTDSDAVILCNSLAASVLLDSLPHVKTLAPLKPIRGQVSWGHLKSPLQHAQLTHAFSYGGYALPLNGEQLLFGASFIPHDSGVEIRDAEHQHNINLLQHFCPKLAQQLDLTTLDGRAALRAQTADYLPLVGQIDADNQLWGLLGLGAKGFMLAPICAELLMSQLCGEALPLPRELVTQLRMRRFRIKPKLVQHNYTMQNG